MSDITEKKIVSIPLGRFVSGVVGVFVAITLAFWAFYTYHISAFRSDYERHIHREEQRMEGSLQEAKGHQTSILELLRRESEAKLETVKIEHKAQLRELELTGQAALARLEEERRRDKEFADRTINGLRQQLATSRSTLEISASGDFLSTSALLLDQQSAMVRMAETNASNVRRLILPDYSTVGWDRMDGVSISQIEAYMREKVIKLMPEDADENDVMWQPLVTLWSKNTNSSVAAVGAVQLSHKEFTEFLQKATEAQVTLTMDKDGTTTTTTSKWTFDAKELSQIPIGITAYNFVFFTLFSLPIPGPLNLKVIEFSARKDALHYSVVVDETPTMKFKTEFLILEDSGDVFLLFNTYSAENELDPVSREAKDWLRNVRILKISSP